MNPELERIWPRLQADLASAVGEHTYRIWLEPLRVHELDHGCLRVRAPAQACGWIAIRFGRVLASCAAHILEREVAVEVIPDPDDLSDSTAPAVAAATPSSSALAPASCPTAGRGHAGPEQGGPGTSGTAGAFAGPQPASTGRPATEPLANPKLTFDRFVIGDCNRLAHAAALTVAELPAQAYNPLFICGPPGVGKTHLLTSIATLLLTHNPGLAIRATTGEAFTTEFLQALSAHHTNTFKARFRDVDVLLVDDVQFLERKARTEEEFFHTFNALHDCGRQIVLTSDRPPGDLQALEDRLRERFGSGLVADIAPPDPATRLTILRKRAHDDRLQLDDRALQLIAQRIAHSVRALEGALIRVVAYGSLTSRPLSEQLAREVLDALHPSAAAAPVRDRPLTIGDIMAATCDRCGLTPHELLSASRAARVAFPRQVAMYLARELTGDSLPAIGRHFGGRDHTTVLHAHRRTASRLRTDASSQHLVDSLLADLGQAPTPNGAAQTDRST